MDRVKVRIVKVPRGNLALRWTDPVTGDTRQKTTGTLDGEKAAKQAADLETKLNSGGVVVYDNITWEQFRDRWDEERQATFRESTRSEYESTFNRFEELIQPRLLRAVTSQTVGQFQAKLAKSDMRPMTIAKHLRHMKAACRWANEVGLLETVPAVRMPRCGRGQKLMRGRPLTDKEFERLLDAVPTVVKAEEVEAWQFFLKGLWWSGLRLSEAIQLYWDRLDRIRIDFSGKAPLMRIPGSLQKNGHDQVCAVAPEFLKLLEQVPDSQRRGQVFALPLLKRVRSQDWKDKTSKVGAAIGRASGIIVGSEERKTGTRTKYATLHDLRRSFGDRWMRLVEAATLREMMRHESITTTMAFYIGRDAERTHAILARAVANL
jgi:integrase